MINGWPSFNEDELVKENVQVDKAGTLMTLDGAMLGEKKSDGRYCVNLSSIAGNKH
jgi:peptide methionine sulfoxide reductase MsrB